MPQVSVVISAYQKAELLPHTLQSVLDQTFDDYEVLVVDDGSTDDTRAVVENFAAHDDRIRYIYQENQGPGSARNTGIRAASADLIALLDGDDVWLPDKLAHQVQVTLVHPEIDVLCNASHFARDVAHRTGDLYLHTHIMTAYTLHALSADVYLLTNNDVAARILRKNPFHLSTALIRKTVWDGINGFDHRFRGTEDIDFWVRAALAGYRFAYGTTPVAIYVKNTTSIAATSTERWWKERLTYALAAHNSDTYTPLRDITRPVVRRAYRELIVFYFRRAQPLNALNAWTKSLAYGLDARALVAMLLAFVAPLARPIFDCRVRVHRAKQELV